MKKKNFKKVKSEGKMMVCRFDRKFVYDVRYFLKAVSVLKENLWILRGSIQKAISAP